MWDGIKRNEIHQIRRDWPDGLGLEGKEVYREGMTRRGGEDGSEGVHMWKMGRNGGEGRGVSVLGSLWVSQVLSGRESGRYLIVIASMERTEAGPVRKFLIYLVFLFSLLFLLPPAAFLCGGEVEESEGGVGGIVWGQTEKGGREVWMEMKFKGKGKKKITCVLLSQV